MADSILQNRYRIDEQIGQGGMGKVFRGYDLVLNRTVAVKVLSSVNLVSSARMRMLSEAQAVARLNHPNIVTVYDAGETDDLPFIVMELVPGETLRQHAVKSLAEVREIVGQICAALEHSHAAGIIHRDLKLENVILTPTGTVKLMDFGLARSNDAPHLTEDGAVIGTFLYIAPELLMGDPPSVQSDLYALGVILYEMACGKAPFNGSDPIALISQHLNATPVPPSTCNPAIPQKLETIILRLLEKQPSDRPASALEVRRALELAEAADDGPVPQNVQLDRVVRGRLVGRERELAETIQMFRQAQQGESGILLISGEPGVGKSRLTRELIVQAKLARGLALVGECYQEGGAPYSAFAQIILGITDWPVDLPQIVLADLIELVPALRLQYPDVPANPALEPQLEQQRLYESSYTFFASLAKRQPILLLLEDVHWADGGTLALARSLARRFRQTNTPLLLVLTFREVELNEQKGVTELLAAWHRERVASQIKLRRLDRASVGGLLETLFAEPVTDDFADSIFRETEGNPFFIEELCKALIESGQIQRENGRWQRRGTQTIELPRSIRLAIEVRFHSLPPSSIEILQVASVLGRRFEFDMLQVSSELDEDSLITALENAEKAQLVFEIGKSIGTTFEFAHAMIPAVLAENLSGMRRRRLNKRVVTALEKLHPQDYKTLAHHCLQANEDDRGLDYLLKAAKRASEACANSEAVAIYQQAVGLLNDLLAEKMHTGLVKDAAVQLYEDLGNVLLLTGQYQEAIGAFAEGLNLLAPADTLRAARLYRGVGKTQQNLLLFQEAQDTFRKAITVLGAEPGEQNELKRNEWWQTWIMVQLDHQFLLYWIGNVTEMEQMVENSRPAVERYGTSAQHAKFIYNILNMRLRMHNIAGYPGIREDAASALKATKEAGDQFYGYFAYGFALMWNRDLDEAEPAMREAMRQATLLGDVVLISRCHVYLTVLYRKMGNLEEVKRYANLSLESAAAAQSDEYIFYTRGNLAWSALREGNIPLAAELAESAWDGMKAEKSLLIQWLAVWPLLSIALLESDIAQAVAYARELLNPAYQPQPEAIGERLQSAILAWEQGQPEPCAAFLEQARAKAFAQGFV